MKVSDNDKLEEEVARLKEECNTYKGRCANLQRDVQVSQSYLQKVSTDTNSANEQTSYMKDRVRNLESDLERALREKTDAACEVRRLTQANDQLEKHLADLKITQMQAKGDSQVVGATAQRMQA
jgi:chromosome segregation ATPase